MEAFRKRSSHTLASRRTLHSAGQDDTLVNTKTVGKTPPINLYSLIITGV